MRRLYVVLRVLDVLLGLNVRVVPPLPAVDWI